MKYFVKLKPEEKTTLENFGFVEFSDTISGGRYFYLAGGSAGEEAGHYNYDRSITKNLTKSGVQFNIDDHTNSDYRNFASFKKLLEYLNDNTATPI